eukprot:1741037-Rhodomonas_salina.1
MRLKQSGVCLRSATACSVSSEHRLISLARANRRNARANGVQEAHLGGRKRCVERTAGTSRSCGSLHTAFGVKTGTRRGIKPEYPHSWY